MTNELAKSTPVQKQDERLVPGNTVRKDMLALNLAEAVDTRLLGENLAVVSGNGALLALVGPLGAGKTTFAQGVGRGLSVQEVINSPTFTMLNEYTSGRIPLYHLDLYRLKEGMSGDKDCAKTGLEHLSEEIDELLSGSGVVLIEWADFFSPYISRQDHILVELDYTVNSEDVEESGGQLSEIGRVARLSATGSRAEAILDALKKIYFS